MGAADVAGAGADEVFGAGAADVAGAAEVAGGALVAVVAAGLDEPEPHPTRISEKIRIHANEPTITFFIKCPP